MKQKFNKIKNILILFLVSTNYIINGAVNVNLAVQNTNFYNGPVNMGIGVGHSSLNGNWLKFFERLGVNAARRFVSSSSNLRTFIGTTKWGQNLNGVLVQTQNDFTKAVADLRTPNGRNPSYNWLNPVKWSSIFNYMSQVSQKIYGSDENTLNSLNSLKINTLLVEEIACSGTKFEFTTLNRATSAYWSERWELYKQSYAMAVWAYNKGVKMIEFYNEPDLDLGTCLTADKYKEYYFVRSLSIQNAYADLNSLNTNKLDVKIVASAFARKTYGGDPTQYLGDVSVKNRNFVFGSMINNTNWTNMHIYSFHSYGKTGSGISSDLDYLTSSVNADTSVANSIPVIITEHNTHTSSSWDTLVSTTDDDYEASRLASQIIYLIKSKVTSHFVFKFSITSSFAATRDVAKNGLHWGEIYKDPYDVSDSTLCAEAMRLLTQMKNSKIFTLTSSDTSSYRTYLGSNNNDGFYYLYAVNDAVDTVNLSIDLSKWMINAGTKIITESVSDGIWGEVSVLTAPIFGAKLNLVLNPYSTTRLAIQTGVQSNKTINSVLSCSAQAGSKSNIIGCSNSSLYVGTSNTIQHENTYISLIKFDLASLVKKNQRVILKLNIEAVLGTSNVTALVLGIRNKTSTWDQNTASWSLLSNSSNGLKIVYPLPSGNVIANVSQNFINWSSSSNLCIVGHITGVKGKLNQAKMIDVTDYITSLFNSGSSTATFVLYRPFRHPAYKTSSGGIPADNLSSGSTIKFSSHLSNNKPQLIQYSTV